MTIDGMFSFYDAQPRPDAVQWSARQKVCFGVALTAAIWLMAYSTAWSQTPTPANPISVTSAPTPELRTIVRQPAPVAAPANIRHLTEQERNQLRRQLARDLHVQGQPPARPQ
jgi:hypothetical protein